VLLAGEPFRVSAARRALDVAASALALVVAAPVLLVAAALVLVTDGRPVLFSQTRLGEGGRPFRMYKVRSMRSSVDGPGVTSVGDPRITPVGRILRAFSIDELPQLWHVLRGQMTLVGPRPESTALAARYPESCRFVLAARPGLTGPSQLTYRESSVVPPVGSGDPDEWYLSVLVPLRTEVDLEFLLRPTMASTVRWLLATVVVVLRGGRSRSSRPGHGTRTPGPSVV
jgi:lipopolysaccharide/colanic/teichoic acid biosynthesis glycosyltransferase